MWKIAEFGELIGISPSTLRLYGLRKYKSKVKKIVDGEDPCEK